MIGKLRKKFILICAVSVFAVILVIFGLFAGLNYSSMNRTMDTLTDAISRGNGHFPETFAPPEGKPGNGPGMDFMTPETRFSTRHFTVWFDEDGKVTRLNTDFIHVVTAEIAQSYAQKALKDRDGRGWISNYRYKVFSINEGRAVVFVDGTMNRAAFTQTLLISGIVLVVAALAVLLLIALLSGRAMKPIAESYEKQKQFITDANHELKTPLTLILANLDIAEEELGKNEWLSDIRTEGNRMTGLVNQLVALSRMDEDSLKISPEQVAFGALVSDMVAEFEGLAHGKALSLREEIDRSVTCTGDRNLLQQLLGILMDNAIKYCDAGGEIFVSLQKGRQTVLAVENTYAAIEELELDRLFDRFYRADKARTFTGGYGVGLSLAKTIVEKHKGSITAYRKDKTHIGFKVVLR